MNDKSKANVPREFIKVASEPEIQQERQQQDAQALSAARAKVRNLQNQLPGWRKNGKQEDGLSGRNGWWRSNWPVLNKGDQENPTSVKRRIADNNFSMERDKRNHIAWDMVRNVRIGVRGSDQPYGEEKQVDTELPLPEQSTGEVIEKGGCSMETGHIPGLDAESNKEMKPDVEEEKKEMLVIVEEDEYEALSVHIDDKLNHAPHDLLFSSYTKLENPIIELSDATDGWMEQRPIGSQEWTSLYVESERGAEVGDS